MSDYDKLFDAYFDRFGVPPPAPASVSRGLWCRVIGRAIEDGEPVPNDFDWWENLPDDAVA